jgi:hypothetical protein
MRPTITPFEAVKRMRELTEKGIPFTFEFLSYNSTNKISDGFKVVSKCQLRKGYRADQSDKADILIGYVNEYGENRWFYLPLIIKFNSYSIKP